MIALINDPQRFFVVMYGVLVGAALIFVLLSRKSMKTFMYFTISLAISLLYFYGLDKLMMSVVQGLPFPYRP